VTKLYTYDPAPNPRRLALFLAYKGIQLPTQQVNLKQGEQFSDSFMEINPRCTVPALQLDDGTVLCEVIAICWYLEHRYPQAPLLGTDPVQQAQILMWDQYVCTDGFFAVAEALRNGNPAFKDRALPGPVPFAQISALEARGRQRFRLFCTRLEEHLVGRDFLVGDGITLADVDAYVLVGFAAWIHEQIPEECLHLVNWRRRVGALLEPRGAGHGARGVR